MVVIPNVFTPEEVARARQKLHKTLMENGVVSLVSTHQTFEIMIIKGNLDHRIDD